MNNIIVKKSNIVILKEYPKSERKDVIVAFYVEDPIYHKPLRVLLTILKMVSLANDCCKVICVCLYA